MHSFWRQWHLSRNRGRAPGWLVPVLAGLLSALVLLAPAGAAVHGLAEDWEAPARLRTEPVPDDPKQLHCRFTPGQLAILEKLNRVDVERLTRLQEITVPDRWDLRELDYSPLPRQSGWAADHGKALVVHQPMQVFGAYENGVLVHWGPVSSGAARRPTPAGLYHLNWKSKGRPSTVNPEWFLRWYFNFVNKYGISFHEYALPGYPASHGCVRMLGRDARWLYEWGDEWQLGPKGWSIKTQGTPVWILGEAEYGPHAPWREREYLAAGGQVSLPSTQGESGDAEPAAPADETADIRVAVGKPQPDAKSKEPGSI